MECFLHLNAIQGVLAPSPSHVSSYSKVYCPSHSSHSIWSLAPRLRAEIERIVPSHLGELIAALSSSSGDIKASAHRIAYPQAANSSCNITKLAVLLADEDMIRRDLLSCLTVHRALTFQVLPTAIQTSESHPANVPIHPRNNSLVPRSFLNRNHQKGNSHAEVKRG
jgi:hypothetical protein